MNIYTKFHIALMDDPRSEKRIIYLPLAGYAQLMTVEETNELTARLRGEQTTVASAAVAILHIARRV